MSLLEVQNYSLKIGDKPILQDLNFSLVAGSSLGLVGESGSGKSLTALSAMQLLPSGSSADGRIVLDGVDLLSADETTLDQMRGQTMSMVFQEPMTALNPLQQIGHQIAEVPLLHSGATRAIAQDMAKIALEKVGLDKTYLKRFPHELSGGQRQRALIAMATILSPKLLIADEPTSALDVSTQREVLSLLEELCDEYNSALLLISHDLAVIADLCDDLLVMKEGRILDAGAIPGVFDELENEYSASLVAHSSLSEFNALAHRKKISKSQVSAESSIKNEVLLSAQSLVKKYPKPKNSLFEKRNFHRALDQVSLEIKQGARIGLVGESGCGKSTLARSLLALEKLDEGEILYGGTAAKRKSSAHSKPKSNDELRQLRQSIQIVFQDPSGSFNPRHKVGRIVAEPLNLLSSISSLDKQSRVREALQNVGLPEDSAQRYPHEFSGGQRQRIAIARAIIVQPKLIIADEPVSALDVSVRGEILALFNRLADEFGLAYLFISHDLHVVRSITKQVLVMQDGKIVEAGPTKDVFDNPKNDYTKSLIDASLDLPKVLAKRRMLL